MDYINLGRTGLKVAHICLGTMSYGSRQWRDWVLPESEARSFLQRALELGINFFDTADAYSRGMSEEVLGRALRDFVRREEVIIATKVFFPMGEGPNERGLSRKHIMGAIHASLRRLGTDYVDLYQIHRWDYETPIEETLEALHDLVKAGKVRYLGASSVYAWQFAKALYLADRHGWTRFVAMQNHYNLIYREEEREMLPLCRAEGVGVIPWSPLARGFLAGNRERGGGGETPRAKSDGYARELYYRETDFAVTDRVVALARRHDVARRKWRRLGCCTSLGSPPPSSGPPRWRTWNKQQPRWRSASLRKKAPIWKSPMSRIGYWALTSPRLYPASPVPGAGIDAAAAAGIRLIPTRTERVAVNTADGYSRLSNGRRATVTHDSDNPRDQMVPVYQPVGLRGYVGGGKSTQLGAGLGLLVGAKLAAPDRLVVNLMGDAAFGMVGTDFETKVSFLVFLRALRDFAFQEGCYEWSRFTYHITPKESCESIKAMHCSKK